MSYLGFPQPQAGRRVDKGVVTKAGPTALEDKDRVSSPTLRLTNKFFHVTKS